MTSTPAANTYSRYYVMAPTLMDNEVDSTDWSYRSYFLEAEGDSLEELMKSAVIVELDKEGEERSNGYCPGDYGDRVQRRCEEMIAECFLKGRSTYAET